MTDGQPPNFLLRGKRELIERAYHEAVKTCRHGLLSQPDCHEARLVLAMALLAMGRYDEVVAEMRIVLQAGDNAVAFLLRGEALLRMGQPAQSYETLLAAQRLDPHNTKVQSLLVEAQASADGDFDHTPSVTNTRVYPAEAAQGIDPLDTSGKRPHPLLSSGPRPVTDFATAETTQPTAPGTPAAINPADYGLLETEVDAEYEDALEQDRGEKTQIDPDAAANIQRLIAEENAARAASQIDPADTDVLSPGETKTTVASRPEDESRTTVASRPDGLLREPAAPSVLAPEPLPGETITDETGLDDVDSYGGPGTVVEYEQDIGSYDIVETSHEYEPDQDTDAPATVVVANEPAVKPGPSIPSAVLTDVVAIEDLDDLTEDIAPVASQPELSSELPTQRHDSRVEHDEQATKRHAPAPALRATVTGSDDDEEDDDQATRVRFDPELASALAEPGSLPDPEQLIEPASRVHELEDDPMPAVETPHDPPPAITRAETPVISDAPAPGESERHDLLVKMVPTADGQIASVHGTAQRMAKGPGRALQTSSKWERYLRPLRKLFERSVVRKRFILGAGAGGAIVIALIAGLSIRQCRQSRAIDAAIATAEAAFVLGNRDDLVRAHKALATLDQKLASPRLRARQAWLESVVLMLFCERVVAKDTVVDQEATPRLAMAVTAARSVLAGKLVAAGATLKKGLTQYSDDWRLGYVSARLKLLEGKPEYAIEVLRKLAEARPKDTNILVLVGDALMLEGKGAAAIKAYSRVLEVNPDHVDGVLGMARSLLDQRELSEAAEIADRVLDGTLRTKAAANQRAKAALIRAEVAAANGRTTRADGLIEQARVAMPSSDALFMDEFARVLVARGDVEEAERVANTADQAIPGRPMVRLNKARIYWRQGRLRDSLAALDALGTDIADVLFLRGRLALSLGRTSVARDALRRLKEIDRKDPDLALLAARILIAEDKLADARALITQLVEKRADDVSVLLLRAELALAEKAYAKARRLYRRVLTARPSSLEALLGRARTSLRVGNFRRAKLELADLIKRHPSALTARHQLAEIHLGYRDLDAAESVLRRALKRVSSDDKSRFALVQVLAQRGDFDSASREVKRLAAQGTGFKAYAVGLLALAQSDKDRAYRSLGRALEKRAGEVEVWLAYIRACLAADRVAVAQEKQTAMAKRFPKRAEVAEALGLIELARGKPSRAARAFDRGLDFIADVPGSYPVAASRLRILLARAQQEAGRLQDALRSAEAATKLCARCAAAFFRRGLILSDLRRDGEATKVLEKAIRLSPKQAKYYYELAKVYENRGLAAKAIKMYRRYLTFDPPAAFRKQVEQSIEELQQ